MATEIRTLHETTDMTYAAIGRRFGICAEYAWEIATGLSCTSDTQISSPGLTGTASRRPGITQGETWRGWARRRGYSEARIAAEEVRIAPPRHVRHICQPGTVCCAAVEGYVADAVDEAAD
jgi:hypothetical protein